MGKDKHRYVEKVEKAGASGWAVNEKAGAFGWAVNEKAGAFGWAVNDTGGGMPLTKAARIPYRT